MVEPGNLIAFRPVRSVCSLTEVGPNAIGEGGSHGRDLEIGKGTVIGEATWDRAARFYRLQQTLERPSLGAAAALSAVESHHRLLDLGTGTGAVLAEFASARRRLRLAVGVELSPQMLIRAKRRHAGHLIRADAGTLPFDDGSFDVVVAAWTVKRSDADVTVSMCAEEVCPLTPGVRRISWDLPDPKSLRIEQVREIRDDIGAALRRSSLNWTVELRSLEGESHPHRKKAT